MKPVPGHTPPPTTDPADTAGSAKGPPWGTDPWGEMPEITDGGLWPRWVNDALRAYTAALVTVLVMLVAWCGPEAPESPTPPAVASDTVPDTDSAFAALVDRVKSEEGFIAHAYPDGNGTWAVGYGFNSTGPFSDADKARWLADGISEAEADSVLEATLRDIMADWVAAWAPYASEPTAVEYALADAAYQLGLGRITHWRRVLDAIADGDAAEAAAAIRASKWHSETPDRAEMLIEVIQEAIG